MRFGIGRQREHARREFDVTRERILQIEAKARQGFDAGRGRGWEGSEIRRRKRLCHQDKRRVSGFCCEIAP